MGWLRLVGSFKLYVSFAECPLFYRALFIIYSDYVRSFWSEHTRAKISSKISSTLFVYAKQLHNWWKEPYKREDILQKRRIIWKSLLRYAKQFRFTWESTLVNEHTTIHTFRMWNILLCRLDYPLRTVSFHMCTYYVYFIYLYSYIIIYLI